MRRYAWARLVTAFVMFLASTGLSAYFIQQGMTGGSFASMGAGALSVVSVMLTGKPLAARRR